MSKISNIIWMIFFCIYLILKNEKKSYFLISFRNQSQKAIKTRPTPKKIQVNFKRSQTSRSWISIIPSSSIFVMLLIIKFDFSFSKGTKCVDEGWPEKSSSFLIGFSAKIIHLWKNFTHTIMMMPCSNKPFGR